MKEFSKILATLPGLIALVISAGVLTGRALLIAVFAEALITRALVFLVPKGTRSGAPVDLNVDTGPGSTV